MMVDLTPEKCRKKGQVFDEGQIFDGHWYRKFSAFLACHNNNSNITCMDNDSFSLNFTPR